MNQTTTSPEQRAIIQQKLESICKEHGVVIIGDVFDAKEFAIMNDEQVAQAAEAETQAVLQNLREPNATTQAAIASLEAGEGVRHATVDSLMADLNSECSGCDFCADTDTSVDEMAGLPTMFPDIEAAIESIIERVNIQSANAPVTVLAKQDFINQLVQQLYDQDEDDGTISTEEVAEGYEALKAGLQQDPGFAWSWHCNIAMEIYDAGVPHTTANVIAARIMQKAFDVRTMGVF